jgi:hypothetical protein
MDTPSKNQDKSVEIALPSPETRAAIDAKDRAGDHPPAPDVAITTAKLTSAARDPADAVRDLMPELREATQNFHVQKKKLDETLESHDIRRAEVLQQVEKNLKKAEDGLEAVDEKMHKALETPHEEFDEHPGNADAPGEQKR